MNRKQIWDNGGITKGKEYAILTDEIYKGWAGMNARGYKNIKGLTKENLRDNMTNMELIFNMLAEATTKELAEKVQPKGLMQNIEIARRGGNATGRARREVESETGKSVITGKNAKELKRIKK